MCSLNLLLSMYAQTDCKQNLKEPSHEYTFIEAHSSKKVAKHNGFYHHKLVGYVSTNLLLATENPDEWFGSYSIGEPCHLVPNRV